MSLLQTGAAGMPPLALLARLAAGVALVLTNAFFVAIEFALTRARQFSEAAFLGDQPAGLELAWEMTDDLELYLTTCQVGITATSIALGIVAEPAVAALFEPATRGVELAGVGVGGLLAFVLLNLVHLTHGEQTPTYLGVERSRQVCRYGARPLYYIHLLLLPVIRLGDTVAKWTLGLAGIEMTGAWLEADEQRPESRAELRARLAALLDAGELPAERREEILATLDIGETPIRELMLPAADIVALSTAASAAENRRRMAAAPHTRYPIVGEELSTFEGILYVPELMRREGELGDEGLDLKAVSASPFELEPSIDVSTAIDRFQAANQELAMVLEEGTVVGMVTITDLLESVIGDLEDPIDAE